MIGFSKIIEFFQRPELGWGWISSKGVKSADGESIWNQLCPVFPWKLGWGLIEIGESYHSYPSSLSPLEAFCLWSSSLRGIEEEQGSSKGPESWWQCQWKHVCLEDGRCLSACWRCLSACWRCLSACLCGSVFWCLDESKKVSQMKDCKSDLTPEVMPKKSSNRLSQWSMSKIDAGSEVTERKLLNQFFASSMRWSPWIFEIKTVQRYSSQSLIRRASLSFSC